MIRSIGRAGASFGAALLIIAVSAAPAFACGGLIGPNGAVNLLRTTTLAGYHDGEEHYITAFQFAGGGGSFGSPPSLGLPAQAIRWSATFIRRKPMRSQAGAPRCPAVWVC